MSSLLYIENGYTKPRQARIEQPIQAALIGDGLLPHFQPRFDSISRRIIEFEALARIKLPNGEMVSSVDFIQVAEEGVI